MTKNEFLLSIINLKLECDMISIKAISRAKTLEELNSAKERSERIDEQLELLRDSVLPHLR